MKLFVILLLLNTVIPLVATFSETSAPTSRKYVAEKGIVVPNLSEKLQFLWLHSSVFSVEK